MDKQVWARNTLLCKRTKDRQGLQVRYAKDKYTTVGISFQTSDLLFTPSQRRWRFADGRGSLTR